MCYSNCILNSLTRNNFKKCSVILNIIQLSISLIILLINLLIFIICDMDLIIKTGFSSYINNIFLCILIILSLFIIEYYRRNNNLTKDKKQATFTLIFICELMTILKCFSSLITIAEIDRIYLRNKIEQRKCNQIKLMLGIIIATFGLYIASGIILIIYILLIYNLRIIIFNNDVNNINRNNGNLSYMSTRPDINDNSQEIIINNLNEGNKNNNFYYLSQNIINKFEKEYEEKEVQTIIK